MKKIKQTKEGFGGNCFEACLASILEVPLEDIPELDREECGTHQNGFHNWSQYKYDLNSMLIERYGIYLYEIIDLVGQSPPPGYSILGFSAIIKTRDGEIGATVGHAAVCFNGQIVWNPDPKTEGAEIIKIQPLYWTVVCTGDPSRFTRKEE